MSCWIFEVWSAHKCGHEQSCHHWGCCPCSWFIWQATFLSLKMLSRFSLTSYQTRACFRCQILMKQCWLGWASQAVLSKFATSQRCYNHQEAAESSPSVCFVPVDICSNQPWDPCAGVKLAAIEAAISSKDNLLANTTKTYLACLYAYWMEQRKLACRF